MLSKVKLLSMFTQCLPNYFSSFTQHQYLPNKSSTIYQETIHTPISSQHMLNILPSQYWPKFVQSLAKLRGWFMIKKCLISSLWHCDILMSVEVTVYGISGLGLGGDRHIQIVVPSVAAWACLVPAKLNLLGKHQMAPQCL